ncbi:hypothetical protein PTTG_11717 [Puccinia triticina 1-1 BBBD Race 1]|uniref:THIF-type NAD/FAD binding fold domain-containing protein n=1 Tax=Puccinia triticina (isolate 1-1 / race 1 (BBBD)) TaxID=630390 RepID=A0A180H4G7_PUCT1|nr:hypothetical protein PTTG_11717 [Puccinia triticina 1-1 BBBD Race 1]
MSNAVPMKREAESEADRSEVLDKQPRVESPPSEAENVNLIEKCAVTICDCSATAAQIAKNLAISGIMRLDMYDDQVVRQSDIGHHLFLDQGSLGKNRSEECCRMLKEVARSKGRDSPWIDGNDFLLDRDHYEGIDEFEGFWGWSAFICVRLNSEAEQVTSRYCWDFYVPAIFVQTCGLVARIRLQIREHSVIQIHPNSLMDLLDCPFPSLSEFVKSFEMDKIDSGERANVPAVVIVIHFLELFKSKHCGIPPLNSAGKAELKEMILAEKQNDNEKNFDEAVDLIEKACQPTKPQYQLEKATVYTTGRIPGNALHPADVSH